MAKNNIGYVDTTWSPIAGCGANPVSPGCRGCWALRMARRLAVTVPKKYKGLVCKAGWTGKIVCAAHEMNRPLGWREERRVAVCYMTDIALAEQWNIYEVIMRMMVTNHTFMVLTKRPDLLRRKLQGIGIKWLALDKMANSLPNVWWGVSVCVNDERSKVVELEKIGKLMHTTNLYASVEPMIEPIGTGAWMDMIRWIIIGGETGPGKRPFPIESAKLLVNDAVCHEIPVWMKGNAESWGLKESQMQREIPK